MIYRGKIGSIFFLLVLFSIAILSMSCGYQTELKSDDKPKSDPPISAMPSKFIIGMYVAPPMGFTTDTNYKAIQEAHIDLIQDISGQLSESDKISMLNMAQKYHLKMIVADNRINGSDQDIQAMVNAYRSNPGTAGYYIKDEPLVSGLQDAANRYKKVLNLDPVKFPHVNLLPNYATGALPNIDYEKEYVEKWIELVGPHNLKYLSFDNYPYVTQGNGDNGSNLRASSYFQNLNIIRHLGLKYKVRTSAYLQSIGDNGSSSLRRPNGNELRYSAFTNLAYGITMPIWFTYWTPNNQFTDAIVKSDGSKTDLYETFKAINLVMKQIGKTLIDLEAQEVYHTGTPIPSGTDWPPSNFIWRVKDNNNEATIITLFINPENDQQYIMVVNKSVTNTNEISFDITDQVSDIKIISKKTGEEESTNYSTTDHTLSDTFLPGEGKLYLLKK